MSLGERLAHLVPVACSPVSARDSWLTSLLPHHSETPSPHHGGCVVPGAGALPPRASWGGLYCHSTSPLNTVAHMALGFTREPPLALVLHFEKRLVIALG